MIESKPTPGPVKADGLSVKSTRGIIARCPAPQQGGVFDCRANPYLIAEAFNVLTETGLTPRQLAEALVIARKQRAELLAALQQIGSGSFHGASTAALNGTFAAGLQGVALAAIARAVEAAP